MPADTVLLQLFGAELIGYTPRGSVALTRAGRGWAWLLLDHAGNPNSLLAKRRSAATPAARTGHQHDRPGRKGDPLPRTNPKAGPQMIRDEEIGRDKRFTLASAQARLRHKAAECGRVHDPPARRAGQRQLEGDHTGA